MYNAMNHAGGRDESVRLKDVSIEGPRARSAALDQPRALYAFRLFFSITNREFADSSCHDRERGPRVRPELEKRDHFLQQGQAGRENAES